MHRQYFQLTSFLILKFFRRQDSRLHPTPRRGWIEVVFSPHVPWTIKLPHQEEFCVQAPEVYLGLFCLPDIGESLQCVLLCFIELILGNRYGPGVLP